MVLFPDLAATRSVVVCVSVVFPLLVMFLDISGWRGDNIIGESFNICTPVSSSAAAVALVPALSSTGTILVRVSVGASADSIIFRENFCLPFRSTTDGANSGNSPVFSLVSPVVFPRLWVVDVLFPVGFVPVVHVRCSSDTSICSGLFGDRFQLGNPYACTYSEGKNARELVIRSVACSSSNEKSEIKNQKEWYTERLL